MAMEEFQDPQYCVQQFKDCCRANLAVVKKAMQAADEAWIEEFIKLDGLTSILDCLAVLGEHSVETLSDAMPRLEVVSCLKAVLNCGYGLECLIRRGGKEGSLIGKIVLALNTNNMLLKIQLFLLLSAVSKHSPEGLTATLDALDYYKTEFGQRHRYSVLLQELSQTAEFPECQATVMAFINYLLSSCENLQQRIRLRSELNALDLADVLSIMRYTENPTLLEQVKLYEECLMRDREEMAMPGGVDITDHQQVFTALLEKVFRTPNSTKLLSILHKMLLIERDTATSDITWNGLEAMTDAALKIYSDQQAQRIATSEIIALRRALEAETARKEREMVTSTSSGGTENTNSSDTVDTSVDTNDTLDSANTTVDIDIVPTPIAPPPPPPFTIGRKTVAEIRTVFDKAHSYIPAKRMKKLNWDKAPDYSAKQTSALWHEAKEERVRVSVSESHIESLFCQKIEGTDGKFTARPTKTYLPDQKKALNVNIVLDGMKTFDPNDPDHIKRVNMSNEEVLRVIREGDSTALTLSQATILMEQAPNEKDRCFLEPYLEDDSSQIELGRVEQYMIGLIKMPDYSTRLRVLGTKIAFQELEMEYKPTLHLLHTAMTELMSSGSLKDLFHIILIIGNFINGNTSLGSAYGFRVSSLRKLSTTLANVRKTTLNVNFLHFLVTVCEPCPRLLKFYTELPSLDHASRVSVEAVQEDLQMWENELNELREMISSTVAEGITLGEDLIIQLEEFVPLAEATLKSLLDDFKSVKEKGSELACYLCDDRDNFLDSVFLEIKNFSDELQRTVKETLKERPISLTPALIATGNKTKPSGVPSSLHPSHSSQTSQISDNSHQCRGLSRATSVITNHVMEIPSSLTPINEEDNRSMQDTAIHQDPDKNPFIFGVIQDDGSPPISMVISPADKSTTNGTADIIVTNIEDDEEEIKNGESESGEQAFETRESLTQVSNRGIFTSHSAHQKSSLQRPLLPPRTKRHSIHEIRHSSISLMSRQASWNEYKGHSPPITRRGDNRWGPQFERFPSCPDSHTIFDGSLEEVAKLLHKMAVAIEKDMGTL